MLTTFTSNTLPTVSATQRKRAARRAHSKRIDGPMPQQVTISETIAPPMMVAKVFGTVGYSRLMLWTASYPAHLQPRGRIPTLAEVRADCRWH